MRKLATVRRIAAIDPIPGADKIVRATVDGWQLVTAIDNGFKVGDLVIYCEIDSWIPHAVAPFLSKGKEPRAFDGIAGERLRTMRMRGQISQGLLLPLSQAFDKFEGSQYDEGQELCEFFCVGADVTDLLGIVKYEAPVPACLAGEVKGMFPSVIPKTDQERIQNLTTEFEVWKTEDLLWEETEKAEGSSMTVYHYQDYVGVCSRNLDLKRNPDNSLWAAAIRLDLERLLIETGRQLAIQGELVGEGIQGNIYKIRGQEFFVYDIYDIDRGEYLLPDERDAFMDQWRLKHVPVLRRAVSFAGMTVADVLKSADGQSVLGPIGCLREGLVYKCRSRNISFKAISDLYLLGEK